MNDGYKEMHSKAEKLRSARILIRRSGFSTSERSVVESADTPYSYDDLLKQLDRYEGQDDVHSAIRETQTHAFKW